MRVVRRPPYFTSMFPTNEVQRKYANISQMFCFRQNSDQFTARTFNDERFAEMFAADASAQTRFITNISVTGDQKVRCAASSDHVTLRGQLLRVAAESGFHIFTMSKAANHVRVVSADMPYRGAKLHGRGLQIYLCRLPTSTGALNAAESLVKKKRENFFRKMSKTYSKMSGQPIWTLNRSHVCHS